VQYANNPDSIRIDLKEHHVVPDKDRTQSRHKFITWALPCRPVVETLHGVEDFPNNSICHSIAGYRAKIAFKLIEILQRRL
jgi:hypothetical protein